MADPGADQPSGQRVPTPGGSTAGVLMNRRPSSAITPGRLPTMRSRDLTLGGVKKVWDFNGLPYKPTILNKNTFSISNSITNVIIYL